MLSSGVGSGRPPHVMFFFVDFDAVFPVALEATGAFPLAAEEGAAAADLPKRSSRFEGGIFEPGQLKRGMALTAV